jgi:cytochrome b6-f complex iron-sulfur subunit/menaquinol-cytochrome c reductase iron-sulfur subunit
MGADDRSSKTGRRGLVMAAALGGCTIAVLAGAPAIVLALSPLRDRSGGERWVRTLRATDLKEGEPKRVAIVADRVDAWTRERDVELGSVWLVRRGEQVIAFSAVCPHLGCSVNVADKGFACPCHTSAFDDAGRRTSGPSPRDLDTLATRIEEGFVAVDFRRFRIGIPEKVEA